MFCFTVYFLLSSPFHADTVFENSVFPQKDAQPQDEGVVTIRSQLKNVSGSCHRLCGASAASPEFTQEHCVLPRPCASADSSYLNRPIVGPTPPKLPASWSSNLRHHRVVCGVSRRTLTILLYPRHSVKGISRNLRDFFVQADSPSPAALRRAAALYI